MPKTIVITGASSGIGAELAKQLGAEGHSLVLAARRDTELKQVAASIGAHALPVVTNVTRRADVERLRDTAIEMFGQVDVWVNNVGRGIGRQVLDLTDQDIDEMMNSNLKSALYGMQAIMPHFQQRDEGHLINVTSFLGRVPMASYRSAYSASKAALNSLTANLRMDMQAQYPNIHVSLLIPGYVPTEFAANALHGTPAISGARSFGGQTVQEVAAVIVALIHDPKPEVYTNPPMQPQMVQSYYQDVGAFEQEMMRRTQPPPQPQE